MGYSNVALKDKIMEMYSEILKHDISVSLISTGLRMLILSSSKRTAMNL